jgi:hypothetical protein
MTSEAQARTLTARERDDAANRLSASCQLLVDTVSGLTAEQWNFKLTPEHWSISECVEHLTISEAAGLARFERLLGAAATPGKASALTDEEIAGKVTDRSTRLKAPETLAPTQRSGNPMDALRKFKEFREQSIAQARATSDDLRAYLMPHPAFGDLDGFQWLCLRAGHTERHTLQIKEVLGNPAFPR